VSTHNLERFRTAQSDAHAGYEVALAEIRSGQKQSHWIWYIFPQLAGLGTSSLSQMYAIDGADEAAEYLQDPVLSERLLTITIAVAERLNSGVPLATLMGSRIDATKLMSSLTLFGRVAAALQKTEPCAAFGALADAAETVLKAGESQGYERCKFTLLKGFGIRNSGQAP
jgi:uncharacterized protein (DUF1810 family)